MPNIISEIISSDNCLEIDLGTLSELRQLGQGGTGYVYCGRLHESEIAIKFLTNTIPSNRIDRFKSEYFNVIALPQNNHVVEYYDFGKIEHEEGAIYYILMPKYDASLSQHGPADEPGDVRGLAISLATSLAFIHDNGIIHRDLKPQNIFIKDKQYVLADFGIAHYDPERFNILPITRKGERLANGVFFAPEQQQGGDIDHRADIFAFGQIIQWFVHGRPHYGTSRLPLADKHSELSYLDVVVDKCLKNDPNQRFQDCHEIIRSLKQDRARDIEGERMFRESDRRWKQILAASDCFAYMFPRVTDRLNYSDEHTKIVQCMNRLADCQDQELIYTNGEEGGDFDLISGNSGEWVMDGIEISPTALYVIHSGRVLNDLMICVSRAMSNFDIYRDINLDCQVAGFLDNTEYIHSTEVASGYAEINGETISLKGRNVEIRTRYLSPQAFLICCKWSCGNHPENDQLVREICEIAKDGGDKVSEITPLINKLYRNKDSIVKLTM